MVIALTIKKTLTYSLLKKLHAAQVMAATAVETQALIEALLKSQMKNLVNLAHNVAMAMLQVTPLHAVAMMVLTVHVTLHKKYDDRRE
jgi:hypothetical protein